MSATANSVNATMMSRRMPVIPYTLRVTCLWREFGPRTTLFGSPNRKQAHEALQMDHDSGRRGGDCALLLYVHGPRQPGMHGVRGVSGALQLRHWGGSHGRRGHGNGTQHRVWTCGERHERDDRLREPRPSLRTMQESEQIR